MNMLIANVASRSNNWNKRKRATKASNWIWNAHTPTPLNQSKTSKTHNVIADWCCCFCCWLLFFASAVLIISFPYNFLRARRPLLLFVHVRIYALCHKILVIIVGCVGQIFSSSSILSCICVPMLRRLRRGYIYQWIEKMIQLCFVFLERTRVCLLPMPFTNWLTIRRATARPAVSIFLFRAVRLLVAVFGCSHFRSVSFLRSLLEDHRSLFWAFE